MGQADESVPASIDRAALLARFAAAAAAGDTNERVIAQLLPGVDHAATSIPSQHILVDAVLSFIRHGKWDDQT